VIDEGLVDAQGPVRPGHARFSSAFVAQAGRGTSAVRLERRVANPKGGSSDVRHAGSRVEPGQDFTVVRKVAASVSVSLTARR
jgi:hypothetical protein